MLEEFGGEWARKVQVSYEGSSLDAVGVEIKLAVVGEFVHHRHDMRPTGRTDSCQPAHSLRAQELQLAIGEQHRLIPW